jgi:cyclopropane fatty-acyl-phospholipid synthase-like methyltransferase
MRGFDAEQIRRYYDRHTSAFVALGQRGSDGAMHRAVWGPGTATHRQAFRYVENQIAQLLQGLPPSPERLNVVDLGCGIGASLCYLAARVPVRGTGITLSPVQARFAEERIRESGFADRIRCIEGDYCDLPTGTGPADLAYAIESFSHVQDPARFFAQCRRLIRPGGLLLICDDFQRSSDEPGAAHTIERFRRGWHINTLITREELRVLARAAGLEHEATTDLSPYLELRRVRDRIANVLLALFGRFLPDASRYGYVAGGSALQTCLERDWIGYDLALFRRLD